MRVFITAPWYNGTLFGLGRMLSLDRLQSFDTAVPERSVYAEAVK